VRTTVTLDPDVVAYLQQLMEEQGLSFKTAINQAVRAAAAPTPAERVSVGTYRMGPAAVDLDHALAVLGELDDDETLRKLAARK